MDAERPTLTEFVDQMCQEKGFKLQSYHKEFLRAVDETRKSDSRQVICFPGRTLGKQFLAEAIEEYYGKH